MAESVRETVRELLESTRDMADYLLSLPDTELPEASSHVCAQGKDLWALVTNDIDHEGIHAGQVLEARYEARATASATERLVAEWLRARAQFISSFIGMSDEAFNAETVPGGWTYRAIAKHILMLEQHSMQTVRQDIARRGT